MLGGFAVVAGVVFGAWRLFGPATGAPAALTFSAGELGAGITGRHYRGPLTFSDGSRVVPAKEGGKEGEVEIARLGPHGALVRVSGVVDLAIRHSDQTAWRVAAGPYTVDVTGTRFRVNWSPERDVFSVEMAEGTVRVAGPGDRAIGLTAGHELQIRGGTWRLGPLGKLEAEGPPPPATPAPEASRAEASPNEAAPIETGRREASPTRSALTAPRLEASTGSASSPGDWRSLARAGNFAVAYRLARPTWSRLCESASAADLMLLGDSARFARDATRADVAYRRALRRAPASERALFALGLVALDLRGDERGANQWFARYLRGFPNGPLAADASGRLLELAARRDDETAATAEASRYLRLAPDGPYAALARRFAAASARRP
jgi:TolA-binding protein